jgi:regulatory protein
MAKITSIEKQKKEGRYNIFLDGEFAFGAYKETVFNFGFRVNDELDEKKIKEIKSYDEINFGKKVAYRFLNYKPRSEKEVITKLREKKISQNSISDVISSLKSLNYLDDKQYAKLYIEEKLRYKPEGRRLLEMKLNRKGLEKETVQNIMEENYSEETEIKKIEDLLIKYEKKVKAKSHIEKKQKCFRYLLSKGFDYELITEVINNHLTS